MVKDKKEITTIQKVAGGIVLFGLLSFAVFVIWVTMALFSAGVSEGIEKSSEDILLEDINRSYSNCLRQCGSFADGELLCDLAKVNSVMEESTDNLVESGAYCGCVVENNEVYCNNKFGYV